MTEHARIEPKPIPFIDVAAQRRRLGARIDEAIARVIDHCQFILGPEVRALEAELAQFCGARHAITCASGTDALVLVLMAKGIGAGRRGDLPVLHLLRHRRGRGAARRDAGVRRRRRGDLQHRSGEPASARSRRRSASASSRRRSSRSICSACRPTTTRSPRSRAAENLFILDDAAQSFGATYKGRPLGTFGHATATSFFPAKPLGCYGDGGAIFTDDDELADAAEEPARARPQAPTNTTTCASA